VAWRDGDQVQPRHQLAGHRAGRLTRSIPEPWQALVAACPDGGSQVRISDYRALLDTAPTREMDGDVGGYLDRLRQDLHDLAIDRLLR
jgi:hypothetical protein